jgi:hypothetical protein
MVEELLVHDLVPHTSNPNILYTIGNKRNSQTYESELHFLKSNDGGETYNSINFGNLFSIKGNVYSRVAVSPANPEVLYLVAVVFDLDTSQQELTLFKSTNGGESFVKTDFDGGDIRLHQAWYDLTLTVSPENSEHVYIGTLNLWKSIDGGNTFNQNVNNSPWHVDQHSVKFQSGVLYAANDGGIYRALDDINQFESLNIGLNITQFYQLSLSPFDSNKLIAGSQDNGGFYYDNGQWDRWSGGDGMDNAISYVQEGLVFQFLQRGIYMYISENFGKFPFYYVTPPQKENGQNYEGLWVAPLEISVTDELYSGFENALFQLDRNNFQWTPIKTDFPDWISEIRVSKLNSNRIFLAIGNQLWASDAIAQSFSLVNSFSSPIKDIQPSEESENILLVVTEPAYTNTGWKSQVYKSVDGGSNFEDITYNLNDAIPPSVLQYWGLQRVKEYIKDDQVFYFLSDNLGNIFKMNSTSTEWLDFSGNLPNAPITDMEIGLNPDVLVVSTYGKGIWKTSLSTYTPIDTDNDGVNDDVDLCPDTPVGVSVDENGCPHDITLIPDPNFEAALINLGVDTDGQLNGQVFTDDIAGVYGMDLENLQISDLTGIQDFISLNELNLYNNSLTEIDVSQNVNLTFLDLGANQLADVNVNNNTLLQTLFLDGNQLMSLDVSNNNQLANLWIYDNPIPCVKVSPEQLASIPSGWSKDESTIYSTNCSDTNSGPVTLIPDPNFEAVLVGYGIDTDGQKNGQVFTSDISGITELNLNDSGVSDLSGIQDFTALTHLYVWINQLTEVDLSQNTNLIFLDLGENLLTTIDVSNNTLLQTLYLEGNQLTSLDVSNNPALNTLWTFGNPLGCIEVSTEQLTNIPSGWSADATTIYSLDCQADTDQDGIADYLDQCPNTPLGQAVDQKGCEVFSFDAFTVYTETPACPGVNDGLIEIAASSETQGYLFDIQLTGNGLNETYLDVLSSASGYSITDLAPGSYSITISLDDGFQTEFSEVVIEAAGDLSAKKQRIDKIGGKVYYSVSGNDEYTVFVNSLKYEFKVDSRKEQTIAVPLTFGENTITIKGADCQSMFRDQVALSSIKVYPNPVESGFHLSGGYIGKIVIYNSAGLVVKTMEFTDGKEHYIPIDELAPGVYFVHLLDENNEIIKVVKK